MSHYKSNLRDIEFNLFEVLGAQEYLGTDGPFAAMDPDTAQMVLREVDRFARDSVWAGSFADTDRTPLELSAEGDITVPDSLHEALQAFYEAGWHTLPLPTHLGGFGAPPSVRWATTELFSGGHATASLWPIGALMSMIIDRIGTEGQKTRFARPMVEQRWGGTMVLTEPDAGSDVGAGVTKAVAVEENGPDDLGAIYHIEGIKRFITSADYQGHDNTVHLVLARPQPDPPAQATPGTKGLSLFIVPKYLVNEDGSLGERNGVRVSNIEKKMGIKGSATCELTMGDKQPCVGYLAGDVHDGIAQMFLVIEYARMMVGTKAMSTLSTGYLNALDYAKLRVQGPDMLQMTDKTAPKVEIINHPDVRRLLMEQKAHAEGMRALVMFTGWVQDQAELAKDAEHGASSTDDEHGASSTDEHGASSTDDDHAAWLAREDLLLPMVKGYCSEKAYELLAQSLQVFGGSGFTQDYPIEQYIRDAKIDTLYEGTTAIQSLDLLFRKIARDQGQTLLWFAEQIKEMTKSTGDDDTFAPERRLLGEALEDTQGHLGTLVGYLMTSMQDEEARDELYKTGLHSVALLESLSELTIGWLLLRQAEVAAARIDDASGDDAAFYAGKIAAMRYFARNVLPKARLRRELAASEDNALMALDAAAF